jgi:hypothetical protein
LENKVEAKAMKVDTQRRHSTAPGEIADAVSPLFRLLKYLLPETAAIRTSGHHIHKIFQAEHAQPDIGIIPAVPSANICFSVAAAAEVSFAASCKFCQFDEPITSAEMVSTLSPP